MWARFFCASHIFSSMSMIQVGSQWSSPLHLADWSASDFYFAATQCRCFEFAHCDSATDQSVNYCSIKHWLRSRTSWSSVRKRQPTLLLRHLETLRTISMLNISRQSNSVQVACRREFVTHCDTFTMDWRNFLHKTSSQGTFKGSFSPVCQFLGYQAPCCMAHVEAVVLCPAQVEETRRDFVCFVLSQPFSTSTLGVILVLKCSNIIKHRRTQSA